MKEKGKIPFEKKKKSSLVVLLLPSTVAAVPGGRVPYPFSEHVVWEMQNACQASSEPALITWESVEEHGKLKILEHFFSFFAGCRTWNAHLAAWLRGQGPR